MKRTALAALLLFLNLSLVFGGEEFKNPKSYGEASKDSPVMTIAEILKDGDKFNKQSVTIEGTVAEVCENKGCWMFVTDGKEKIRVDFKNYGFFVPWGSEGKRVRVEGKVYKKTVDKNVAKHWAEDQKSPEVKPEDITEDQVMVMLTAFAVTMENGTELPEEQQEVVSGKKSKEE
ncbi:MAG: DUF4920 domain-containing protein [Bacteroidota bacterium]